jgi:Zincin-like metallopeptidase
MPKQKAIKKRRQPNTALALAKALHRYARIDEPADVFDAVCADWPHRIAVLVNDYLFFEVDACDPQKMIDRLEERLASYVFNAARVDGFAAAAPPEPLGPIERVDLAERFLAHTGVKIAVGDERAFYRPSTDAVQMPNENLFTGTDTMNRSEAWYATALHETAHWSGAKHRLNRDFGKRFGDQAYIAEELVAEIASAFPVRRAFDHAGSARRPRAISRALAEAAEIRRPGDFHRRAAHG